MQELHYNSFLVFDRTHILNMPLLFLYFHSTGYKSDCLQLGTSFSLFLNCI